MKDPCFIDWQGASVLPLALQSCIPPLVEYQPHLFQLDGQPLLDVSDVSCIGEVPWPADFDELSPSDQEIICAEHRIATRSVRWELFLRHGSYARLFSWPFQRYIDSLPQGILRACADGPLSLMFLLVHIKKAWDENVEKLSPCPYTTEPDELQRYEEERKRDERFDHALSRLLVRLRCSRDGCVEPQYYESSMQELARARLEWDEESCAGPFPFEDGRWGQFLR